MVCKLIIIFLRQPSFKQACDLILVLMIKNSYVVNDRIVGSSVFYEISIVVTCLSLKINVSLTDKKIITSYVHGVGLS